MENRLIDEVSQRDWNITHVPRSALGRFFIADLLPRPHKRILYLDGDTLFLRDPSALIDFCIPEGRFAAVEDSGYFARGEVLGQGKSVRAYLRNLGVDGNDGYFNSGVLLVAAQTWKGMSREAMQFICNNTKICRYHDQSALNAIIGRRRLRLSLAWNFQTAFRYWGIEDFVSPKIYHFTEGGKPWMGPVQPWSDLYPFYEQEFAGLSDLKLPKQSFTSTQVSAFNRRCLQMQRRLRYLLPLRLKARMNAVSSLMQSISETSPS